MSDAVYKYYLIKLNGREVTDYAETIDEAIDKWHQYDKEVVIVTPITWETNYKDLTTGEIFPAPTVIKEEEKE